MKNISRVALLTVLLSASVPMFSEDKIENKTEQSSDVKTPKGYLASAAAIPGAFLSTICVTIPQTCSDYTVGGALKKVTEKIEYLKDGKLAKYSDKLGFVVVYAAIGYGLYKLYMIATTEKDITDDVFVFDDKN